MSAARENFENLLSGLAVGDMKAVQAGLMGIRGSIVATSQALWAFVTTPLGAFVVALIGIGSVVKAWANYNEEVSKANTLTASITKLSGEAVNATRLQAEAIAESYDQDYTKVLETARVLVNEFGISYTEALDRIEIGLIKGGAANDEFLDSMKEYPTFFANAGYSVEEFQNLINSGIDLGIYQDKLPDAIKEFSLSVNEQTKGVSDALRNAFGKEFTDKLLKGVKNGSISVKEALKLVADEAQRIGLNAQQAQQLTADLFRGAGEDAGGALKIFEAVRKSIESQVKPLTEAEQATKDLADSQKSVAQAQDQVFNSEGYSNWKKNAMIALNTIKRGFYDLVFEITNSSDALQKLREEQSEKSSIKQYTDDQIKNFEDYVERRKKSMGALFDFEKVREERIATIRQQLASANAGAWDATEAEQNTQKRLEAELTAIKNYQVKITKVKNTNSAADQDAAKKAADEAEKLRKKQLEEARKHAAELLKIEQELQKQLLTTRRAAQDLQLGLIKDDYDREAALINTEFARKIEDLKANMLKEQEAIATLNKSLTSGSVSKSDKDSYQKQLDDRLEIANIYKNQLVTLQQTRDLKLGALEEKYLNKSVKDQESKNANDLQNLQTKHTNELTSIKTFEDAQLVLKQYYTDEEIKKVSSLADAKIKIREAQQKAEIKLQEDFLVQLSNQLKVLLATSTADGLSLISEDERTQILKFLDDAASKIAELRAKDSGNDEAIEKKDKFSGIDLLGFTPDQWAEAFENFDTLTGKIDAIAMAYKGVSTAVGMYFNFLEAGEKRSLQKFETSNRKKQNALNDQLEKGYITEEIYTARKAKLENEYNKKKAEIEYKQAKREKAMNIANIIMNTAVGVSKALAQGGLLGIVTGGLVAAFGALQLVTAAKQPLPSKDGFYDGGYTGSGPERSSPGPVHYEEYVVPKKVLFSGDPVVPNIIGYLENKRTGNQANGGSADASVQNPSVNNSSSSENNGMVAVLSKLNGILEDIESNGIIAYLVNDLQTAKKMRDKIKELEKLENKTKP